MRRSQLFVKTRYQTPADEESLNAQLLIRAGYIHKQMAGVYAYLPLGLKVLENIKQIVREEMNTEGGQELIMTSLQPKDLWEKTDRWDSNNVDVWFKTKLQNDIEIGLAWSHEEPIVDMMREFITSYRDLPIGLYQFQTKLRNELRAKSGIMRGREFVMKDLYSFTSSAAKHDEYYKRMIEAYTRIFNRLGIGDRTFLTTAEGGPFTSGYSHEFQTVCDVGEDTIYLQRDRKLAMNQESYTEERAKADGFDLDKLEKVQAAEVGNIFSFGTVKSEQLGLNFVDEEGNSSPVYLGSYGIGITRLMGLMAELFSDDKGLVWPVNVAPYQVYLCRLGVEDEVVKAADKVYEELQKTGVEVLYDDRGERPGEQFADADLLGIPQRLVVSAKSLQAGGYELKSRTSDESKILSLEAVIETLGKSLQA